MIIIIATPPSPRVKNEIPSCEEDGTECSGHSGVDIGFKTTYPPLKRPSVRHATSNPRPAPMMRLVGFSISGMPKNTSPPENRSGGHEGINRSNPEFTHTHTQQIHEHVKIPP